MKITTCYCRMMINHLGFLWTLMRINHTWLGFVVEEKYISDSKENKLRLCYYDNYLNSAVTNFFMFIYIMIIKLYGHRITLLKLS